MRGGKRQGAGRKPGSRNRVLAAAKDRLRAVLQSNEQTILRRLLNSANDEVLLKTYSLILSYTDGKPHEALTVEHTFSVEKVLEELAARRLARPTVETRLLPAGDVEQEA